MNLQFNGGINTLLMVLFQAIGAGRSQGYICKTGMEMYQEHVILLKVSPDILLL